MVDQRGKARRAQWDSQHDAVITAQKDVRQFFRAARKGLDPEPLSIERLPSIGYLDPLRASVCFVVEVGIKKSCGLITWTMVTCGRFSNKGYVTVCCCD
jgi:hypothetical protein